MNAPTPQDDNQAMRDALQRDAARVPEPPFDAALHYATVRRLRALADAGSARPRFWLRPALATAAAAIALTALVWLWPRRPAPPDRSRIAATSAPIPAAPRGSLLAYQEAAGEGDATLFAMLDRDAATLLPASPPVFAAVLP